MGYQAHACAGADSGSARTPRVTAANIRDVSVASERLTGGEETVYGKSGYPDTEKRRDAVARSQRGRKIKYRLNRRPLPASGILFVAVGTAPGGRH